MELGEGAAQICRLCGQCESIYIDVFGEEGTKRFLGLKIHARINILIKENDGLSQIVCMRCLGTLEFLCDFYERCHLTQKELLEASQNGAEERLQQENDMESDKENTVPSANETKRKANTLSPDSSKSTKNCLSENNTSYCKSVNRVNNDHIDDVEFVTQTKVQLNNLISEKQSSVNNRTSHEKVSRNDQNNAGNLKYRKILMAKKVDISQKTVIRARRSMNNLNSSQKNVIKDCTNSKLPVRRKRGRKSKLEKMREASLAASLKQETQNDLDDRKSDNFSNECKRQCLRAICTNSKSNSVTNNTVISPKPQVDQVIAKEQVVVGASTNEVRAKGNETDTVHDDDTVTNKSTETGSDGKNTIKYNDTSRNAEDNFAKSKAISVIVKQEKGEKGNSRRQNGKSNQLVWISNKMLTQKGENLMQNQIDQKKIDLSETTALLVEERRKIESNETGSIKDNMVKHSDIVTSSNCNDLKSKMLEKENRMTVIRSSQSNEMTSKQVVQEDLEESCNSIDTMDESTKSNLECSISDSSLSRRFSRDSSLGGNRSKDRSFGKIAELISDEQKQTIETYYTVDMSIVNSEEVQKNITIVDKKNIRCNICGTLYLRMDKCQVHIWGHLQMKPYQCKACDFSTVTVTNVRCHIRKSHLKIKPFTCHLCEKRYVTAVLLEEHINTHTGARPYKCKLCDFASSSRQLLSYHNTTHKPMKDINCKICGKEFYSRGRLRAHMVIHNKDKVVMCKLCSAYLSNAEALETHHRNIHMQDYVCNICGKQVKSRKSLYNHQNVHAAAKYKCTLCPNMYKSSQILKEHLLKHEGIRKYKCSVCEKSFGQQSHLAAHMAVHSKIRFHCPGCDKPFNRHDNMKIHTKRCKLFLENPDLKKLLTKREMTISFSNITELTESLKTGDTSNSVSGNESLNETTSIKNTNDQEVEAAVNLCKLGLNISCIKPTDKTWDHNNLYEDTEEVETSSEINVINIAKVNEKFISENENRTVLENILGPESY
ncbi:PREDICTED: zinc finger protein MSN2-like [Habropoda laboriosa]|uniref:zinc finger protein MSN2-like n=1 Tax=Habropoda laboriosa TaxID=597456 RepID=UPI00083E0931|nr:PREDICTED: zinc finger protein MSN2-like [Habropoda laboriosa]